MPLSRNGFTLVELVVALVLSALVGLLAGQAVSRAAALTRAAAERQSAAHHLNIAAGGLRGLLESPAHGGGSLLTLSPSGLTAPVIRGQTVVCLVGSGFLIARRGTGWWNSARDPAPGRDSLAVGRFSPGWLVRPLQAAPSPRPCPDGSPGLAFAWPDSLPDPEVGPGSPLRYFEPVEIRSYSSSGSEWLGVRLVATGEAIQPLAGPLSRPGLDLEYWDSNGAAAAAPGQVSTIRFRILAGRDSVRGVISPWGSR